MDILRLFSAAKGMLKNFELDVLKLPVNLLLAKYLVFLRMLFDMGPTFLFGRGVELLTADGLLTLVLLTD